MPAIIAGVGLAITAASVGYGMSGAGQPTQPNLAASSKEMSDLMASFLPIERGMAAAAQMGSSYTFSLPEGVDASTYGFDELEGGTTKQVFIPSDWNAAGGSTVENFFGALFQPSGLGKWVAYNEADFKPGGKYAYISDPITRKVTGGGNGKYTVDFTGYGAGDVQAKIATQMAESNLALAQKYDSQFIEEALKQQKLADPEGFAARARMDELMQEQINRPLVQPVAEELQRQVGEQVAAGKGLDRFSQETLDRAVADALASRGGQGAAGTDFSEPLTTGLTGNARQLAAIQKGQSFLGSGTTPEDVAYRRNQQDMANLSARINGATPQSQFGSMSAAQQGPTPQVAGAPLPTMPSGSGQMGANAAAQQYATASQQANPWMAGMGTVLNAAGALGQMGWKPLAN